MSHEVWIDDVQAGNFSVDVRPGFQKPSMTFTYLDEWLSDSRAFPISPDLPLKRGPHTPASHRTTFLAFDDAAPDSWGRNLLDAGLRKRARTEGARFVSPSEIELLLAVDDETRQGALRFRKSGTFLADEHLSAAIHEIPKLVDAAQRFTESGEIDEAVTELIGVGSSPGGAQPKAWVRDDSGEMHLAKFPRNSDTTDVSAWELATIRMQRRAGIHVQESSTVSLGASRSVLLTRRFDRDAGHRIPYMSFRSAFALGQHEHPDYATLARRVATVSANPSADAAELFSRAAFIAMANNIDDHMRNHGLLHRGNGWRLAPSFDVNPSRTGRSDTPLTPEDDPGDRDVRLLVKHSEDFRLTRPEAIQRIRTIDAALSHWREEAMAAGVEPDALEFMAKAFEGEHRDRAADVRDSSPTMIDLASGRPSSVPGEVWVRPHSRNGRLIDGHFRRRSQ
ncbi:type II toxin-antitoxin system HipA family toxin [Arthrobacter sp. NA-172]|uniref:type II toxin-antitoxin system HipA family toxin n=1 Tax=Arthrobacter sp. NA-172 TaxID=3367524 RepID=UPI0037548D7A